MKFFLKYMWLRRGVQHGLSVANSPGCNLIRIQVADTDSIVVDVFGLATAKLMMQHGNYPMIRHSCLWSKVSSLKLGTILFPFRHVLFRYRQSYETVCESIFDDEENAASRSFYAAGLDPHSMVEISRQRTRC